MFEKIKFSGLVAHCKPSDVLAGWLDTVPEGAAVIASVEDTVGRRISSTVGVLSLTKLGVEVRGADGISYTLIQTKRVKSVGFTDPSWSHRDFTFTLKGGVVIKLACR